MPTIQELGIDKWSQQDRRDLADQILESLPTEIASSDVPPEHLMEVQRRIALCEAHPERLISFEDLKRELLGAER